MASTSSVHDLGRPVGVQCKLTSEELEEKTVIAEVAKAEAFKPPLSAFYVATSGKRDAKIQAAVRVLSEARVAASKFPVGVIFWEDIVADLVANPADLRKHYPELVVDGASERAGFELLCALDLAYWGLGVKQMQLLIFGSGVQEDPLQMDKVLRSVEESARALVDRDKHTELVAMSRECIKACHDEQWETAKSLATKIETIVDVVEYRLAGRSLAAFTLGRYLRRWDALTSEDKAVSTGSAEAIVTAARTLAAGNALADEMKAAIEKYNANKESMTSIHDAHRAYNHTRGLLLREGMQ